MTQKRMTCKSVRGIWRDRASKIVVGMTIALLIAASAPALAAAQPRMTGDEILAVASEDYGAASKDVVLTRLGQLFDHLEVPEDRRERFRDLREANFAKNPEYYEAPELSGTILVARKSVKIGFARNVVVISGGKVDIAHAYQVLVVAAGSISLAHEARALGHGEAGGLYVTKETFRLSHADNPFIYAVQGAKISHGARMSAYNTDIDPGSGGSATKYVRAPLFDGEPKRDAPSSSAIVSTGESMPYSGVRCKHRTEEARLLNRLLPLARREANCPQIDSARVECEFSNPPGGVHRSRERWVFSLCGRSIDVVVSLEPNSLLISVDRKGDPGAAARGRAYGIPPPGQAVPSALSADDRTRIAELFKKASNNIVRGELIEARDHYRKVLEIDRKHDAAMRSAASLDADIAAADAAAAGETAVIQQGRGTARVYANRGLSYLNAGDIGRAVVDFQKAKSMAPTDADILLDYGTALLRANRLDESTALVGSIIARYPRLAKAYEIRAWNRLLLNEPEDAYKDAFSSLVEAPSWTKSAWVSEKAAYRVLAGYFALRMTNPRAKAAAWLQQWKTHLVAENWPDAMVLYLIGEADEKETRAIAEAMRKDDRGNAAGEEAVFNALEAGFAGRWDEGRRRMREHFRTRYGAGHTLAWVIYRRSTTRGQQLRFPEQ